MTTTWVLLRGLARDRRHWESFPERLAGALGEGVRVVTPDLPGNGESRHLRSPSTVPGMVEAYRDQLTQGSRVHVLGLSLGAMVAIDWARRYPDEVASLVLVNGSAGAISPPWQRLRPEAARELASAALPGRTQEGRERCIVGICSNLAGHDSIVARWARYAREAPTSPANAARQLLAAMRYRWPESRPDVPALVIASSADRLVSAECSMAIARRGNWPLLLHATSGHEIALDDPGWLARQCARWQAGFEHLGS